MKPLENNQKAKAASKAPKIKRKLEPAPEIPHKARVGYTGNCDEEIELGVHVEIPAPVRVAAMLPELRNGFSLIQSVGIGNLDGITSRIKGWQNGVALRRRLQFDRSGPERLLEALQEGLDAEVHLWISVEEWHLIGILCGKCGISPGQYLLAGAMYSAACREYYMLKDLDKNGGAA